MSSFPLNMLDPGFLARVSAGLVTGWERFTQLGHVDGVSSANVPQDVWSGGGAYPWLTADTACYIKSSSTEDRVGGTGMSTGIVNAIKFSDGLADSIPFTLNGTNNVPLVRSIGACNGIIGMLPGIANAITSNLGTVTLFRTSDNAVLAVVPPKKGSSQQSQVTVPLNKIMFILGLEGAITASAGNTDRVADVDTWFQTPGQVYRQPRRVACTDKAPTNLEPKLPIIVRGGSRFQLSCTAVNTTQATSVNGAYEALLWTPALTPDLAKAFNNSFGLS